MVRGWHCLARKMTSKKKIVIQDLFYFTMMIVIVLVCFGWPLSWTIVIRPALKSDSWSARPRRLALTTVFLPDMFQIFHSCSLRGHVPCQTYYKKHDNGSWSGGQHLPTTAAYTSQFCKAMLKAWQGWHLGCNPFPCSAKLLRMFLCRRSQNMWQQFDHVFFVDTGKKFAIHIAFVCLWLPCLIIRTSAAFVL